jgi:hypothetical protein
MTEPSQPDHVTVTQLDDEWTMRQSALLDAVRDIALCEQAPGAEYAARHLVRLAALEFGHPVPEPVEREGGFLGMLYGNPVKSEGT